MTRIALIQNTCSDNPAENLKRTERQIIKAAAGGARIIALQELFTTPYFCREMDASFFTWAEPIPGPITKRLCRLAGDHEIVILAPIFECQAAGIYYNSMVTIDADGTLLGTYRKSHIPDDPGFHEKYYFTPGDSGYRVWETAYGDIGTLICWDQWFPEAARINALMGADLIVFPTAIGTIPGEGDTERGRFLDAWQIIQRSHAIANGCFVASINRTGVEGGTRFWGNSFITGPFGEILAQAGEEEQILSANLDFAAIEDQRQAWPFFRDRRMDTYDPILKRWIPAVQDGPLDDKNPPD